MINELEELRQRALDELRAVTSLDGLPPLKSTYLGKSGRLTALLKGLRNATPEERRTLGKRSNEIKVELTDAITARHESLINDSVILPESFDVTQPGSGRGLGRLHPITQMIYDLNDAFATLGFEVYDGPEISSELFAFDVLNFPDDHPAREMMDTYWIKGSEHKRGAERLCMRPHLTGGSVRYMREHTPPFRFVYPGQVFRNEATDASHERAFFQYEALIVDKKLPFASGELLIKTVLESVFGRTVNIRMRTGFFPFVEPGFEIDMECLVCQGEGCSVCKRVGWIEVMPGGPPHPRVFEMGGIDPNEWEGFYINIGLDRLVMMRTGVDDVRLFHGNDLRFLSQFQ